jgi:two-component system, OmpR family, osmolarity sensor histidine kinase EnvZ
MFGRTAGVIFVALLLSQAVTLGLLHYFVSVPRANLGIGQFVTHLKTIRAALDTMADTEHSTFIRLLNDRDGIRILRMQPDAKATLAPDHPPFRFFRERVKSVLGPSAEVMTRPQNPRVIFVKLEASGVEYWIAFPRARLERDPAMTLVFAAAISALIALLAASFVVWRINRPLRALAKAAHALGEGQRTPAVAETGPTEIQAVTREFNRMNDALLRVERERAAFLAGVSHDLRTPISRVRLGLEMSGADSASRDAMVADLDEMNQVIEQFLVFARDESNEALSEVALLPLLEAMVSRSRGKQSITLVPTKAAATILGRPMALQRLFANLIDNAVKYGAAPIEVTVEDDLGDVIVGIADRGPGIALGDVARLKQPFVRRDDARGGPIGSGLGLAIAERIAQLHGTTVDLLPRSGGGLLARVRFFDGKVSVH